MDTPRPRYRFLLFALVFIVFGCKARKINNMHIMNDKNVGFLQNPSEKTPSNPYSNTSQIYSDWSTWSRCEKCTISRYKTCRNLLCAGKILFEEKLCHKKRCARKRHALKSKSDVHVMKEIRESSLMTRTMVSRVWSKWSEWSECSPKCRTRRYRICRKPGRCKKKRQVQSAYCFLERTRCQEYVLNLLNYNDYDISKYSYNSQPNSNHYNWKKKCGRPFRKTKMLKIIGGRDSERDKWPWHVALQNIFNETFCGGTLIAPRWVLTAGHCLRKHLRVRVNEHDLTTYEGREQEIVVSRTFLHPNFSHITVDNDIALLRLPIPVTQPVACLPISEPTPKDLCFVMGWGKARTHDILGTKTLKEAKLPIVHKNTCRRSYRGYIITHNMFCAGWKSGVADTCAGDSGGGLMCPVKKKSSDKTYVVQGITSFGDGCGRKNKYGIYTNVNNYLKWIEGIVQMYS